MTVLNAAHPLLSGLTGSADTSGESAPQFADELGELLETPDAETTVMDGEGGLEAELAGLALGGVATGSEGPGSSDDVPLPDAGLILGGTVPGHFGEAWKAGAGEGSNGSAGARVAGSGAATPGAQASGENLPVDGELPGAAADAGESDLSVLPKSGALAEGKAAGQAAGEDAGRRWQSALPPELRAAAQQQSGDGAAAQEALSSAADGSLDEAGQLVAAKAQAAATKAESRIWRAAPGSIFAANEGAANANAAPTEAAATKQAGVSTQTVTPASAEAVAAAAQGRGTASGLASQVDVAGVGAPAAAEDVSLPLDGEIDTSARRTSSDLRPAVGAQANNPAGAQSAGSQAATAQSAASQPTLASAAPQSMTQTADAPVDLVFDDADLPPALQSELALEPDFAATVRGGEMQGATRTEALQMPNQTQSSHVAAQVAVEMARNLKNAQTRFQMRFDPPELGRVDVNMKVAADGSVQAHLIVERPETLDMFLRDQRGLERALEAAGLNTNSNDLQFSLKQQGTDQQLASGQDQSQHQGNSDQTANDEEGAADNVAGGEILDSQLVRMALAEQRGGLDISI